MSKVESKISTKLTKQMITVININGGNYGF